MKKTLLILAIVFAFGQVSAQKNSFWKSSSIEKTSKLARVRPNISPEGELYFTINLNALNQTLSTVHDRTSTNNNGVEVIIPNINGELEKYLVFENSNFEPALQAQYPNIRAYKGKGITDNSATLSFSVSPQGIQTMVLRTDGNSEFIEAYDKSATTYVLFDSKSRNKGKLPFNCSTVDTSLNQELLNNTSVTNRASNAVNKTMRLALSCTAEYANYFGATSAAQSGLVLAAMNASITRCNGVMEKDLALHLNIIANNAAVYYYNPTTDPYDDAATGSTGTWNAQVQSAITSAIGAANYDIGHLFGASGGGGNAGCIGCVCTNATKGSGYTSPADEIPTGDNFDIDYVVHEIGHQLGGNHSFTFSFEGSVAQVEPGSGSTIMGYAGITSYNVALHSDALFCYKNIQQIQTNLATKTCPITTVTTNSTPTASAGLDYTIPKGTAFVLTGTSTDTTPGDVLTYVWEENDLGTSATTNAASRVAGTKVVGPNFRTFPAASTPVRYFPRLDKIMLGQLVVPSNWESVYNGAASSAVNRNLNFTFTVRDNHTEVNQYGQTATDAMVVTVNVAVGPLVVSSQSTTGITWGQGSTQTVTWTGFNSNTLAGGANVDILLSTDGGLTFPTVLAAGVPNNGSATVTVPSVTSSTCRLMIKASANVFLAVNSKVFAIAFLANDSFELPNFSLFPNPNRGNFTVQFDSTSNNDIAIEVNDIRGRSVFEKTYTNTGLFSQTLQLNNPQSGIYLVTIKDGNKQVVKKIVVE